MTQGMSIGGLGGGDGPKKVEEPNETIEKAKLGIVNTLFSMNDRMKNFSSGLED
jgi:hypothetical protein